MPERLPLVPEPLTPEERALAARLARLGPHGEPSPALDARILAAARAELPASAAPLRKPGRWPLAFGIAASVALAVGVAWQLRPLPEPVAYDEAAMVVGVATPPPAAESSAVEQEAGAPAETTIASEPAAPRPLPAEPPRERRPAAFQRIAEPAGRESAGAGVRSEPQPPRSAPAAPPAPPPAPVVQQAPSPAATESAASVAADMALPAPPPPAAATGAAKATAPAASPQAATRDAAQRRASAAAGESNVFAEPDVEDIPPATADSPSVRDAWLHRIRELHAAGDTDAARASLREFTRRYPGFPVPDDLQPLLLD